MITIKTRTVDAGVYCLQLHYLQLHYLIEHFIAGKKEEEIDWRLVNTLNNLFKSVLGIPSLGYKRQILFHTALNFAAGLPASGSKICLI